MPEMTLEEVEAYTERAENHKYLPEDRLTRADAAIALRALGYPVSYESLSRAATRRDGPPYFKWGKSVYYKYSELVAWAVARTRRFV
jgi:hypothetical protein